MKKLVTILLISFLFVCGCGKKLTGYTEISYLQLESMKEEGKSFPLVIGSSTCSACESYKVTMRTFIEKYQVEVYFVDLDKFTTEEKSNLHLETNYQSTPTTVFYENGKITMSYNTLVGAEDIQTVKSIFKDNNYLD